MSQPTIWKKCLDRLEEELSAQQFNTWIRPLQPEWDKNNLRLLAPNRFVTEWVKDRFAERIAELAAPISWGLRDRQRERSGRQRGGQGPGAP